MKTNTQSGSIYISSIILLSFVTGLSLLSFLYQFQILNLQKNELLFRSKQQKSQEDIANNLALPPVINQSQFECYGADLMVCTNSSSIYNPYSLIQNLSYSTLIDKQEFPQIDFEHLLSSALACAQLNSQLNRLTSFGNPLSIGSSVWHNTCLHADSIPTNSIIYKSNLESAVPLEISALAGITPAMIASPGYIHINSQLTAQQDLIIVAGGDINIQMLTIISNARLTIISTTGMISINQLSGMPKLRVISRHGHFIQGQYLSQPEPLLPKLLKKQLMYANKHKFADF